MTGWRVNTGATSLHSCRGLRRAERATSNEQRATSNEQRATSNEQRATSNEQREALRRKRQEGGTPGGTRAAGLWLRLGRPRRLQPICADDPRALPARGREPAGCPCPPRPRRRANPRRHLRSSSPRIHRQASRKDIALFFTLSGPACRGWLSIFPPPWPCLAGSNGARPVELPCHPADRIASPPNAGLFRQGSGAASR